MQSTSVCDIYKKCEKKLIVYHVENILKTLIQKLRKSNCAICGSKKSRFIKEQQAKRLSSNLGIKTPLNKVPLLNILF